MGVFAGGRTGRAVVGAGVAGLLFVGAVGCTGGNDSGQKASDQKGTEESPEMTPVAAVAAATKNAEAIKSLHYRMKGEVPGQGRIEGEASMSMEPLAMSMKMTASGEAEAGTVEIRLVGKAMYINGGAEAAKEMDGKSWMKFDMSSLASDKDLNQLGNQADKNPAEESSFMTGSKDLKKVGTETVDGVRTTHYTGTVTLDQIREALGKATKETRAKREKALKSYEDMGLDKFAMDMWIDGEQHTKQFRMRGTTTSGKLDTTVTFLDFNQPVTVQAPRAADTVDLAKMMKDAQAAQG